MIEKLPQRNQTLTPFRFQRYYEVSNDKVRIFVHVKSPDWILKWSCQQKISSIICLITFPLAWRLKIPQRRGSFLLQGYHRRAGKSFGT